MQVQVSLKIEIAASADLTQMEHQIQEAGQQAMRTALKQTIRQKEEEQVRCPQCGETRYRLEGTTRRVVSTVFGRVEVARRRFRCQNCLHHWCPANRLLAGLHGGVISKPLQETAILAGCSWSQGQRKRRIPQHPLRRSRKERMAEILLVAEGGFSSQFKLEKALTLFSGFWRKVMPIIPFKA